jgi:G:T-mismatch repair DNA endonuclease (very short patch repair protein)
MTSTDASDLDLLYASTLMCFHIPAAESEFWFEKLKNRVKKMIKPFFALE